MLSNECFPSNCGPFSVLMQTRPSCGSDEGAGRNHNLASDYAQRFRTISKTHEDKISAQIFQTRQKWKSEAQTLPQLNQPADRPVVLRIVGLAHRSEVILDKYEVYFVVYLTPAYTRSTWISTHQPTSVHYTEKLNLFVSEVHIVYAAEHEFYSNHGRKHARGSTISCRDPWRMLVFLAR